MQLLKAIFVLVASVALAEAKALTQKVFSPYALTNKTLVLYDVRIQDDFTSQYSQLLQAIRSSGSDVDVKRIEPDSAIALFDDYEQRLYDNLLVMPSKSRLLASNLDFKSLEEFSRKGGNMLLLTSGQGSQTDVSVFLNQLGIYPSPKAYRLVDYHNSNNWQLGMDKIENPVFLNPHIVPEGSQVSELAYENGSAALLAGNEFIIPVLRAKETSITYDVDRGFVGSQSTWHSGSDGFLMLAHQARNNARVFWAGSDTFLADSHFQKDLAHGIWRWVSRVNGVLKSDRFEHTKVDRDGLSLAVQDGYKVKDFCKFETAFSKWNGTAWVPYETTDAQLEFIMLDPYYRLNLTLDGTSNDSALYSTTFQIPDHHGMFTFKVDYSRPGLTFLKQYSVVPVRHLANDEYPRSWQITNSWVYVASFFSVVVAWLVFVFLFIVSGKKPLASAEKKKE